MGNVSFKSLARLQFLQMKRSKGKSSLYGYVFGVIYFWIIEFVLFFILRSEELEMPALVPVIVSACFLVPDFLLKLIFEHDSTVMDAFLKTRPVPQDLWDRFLSLSQFWRIENLEMPLAMAPLLFLFMPVWGAFTIFVILYLFSVFGGFLVMLIKHRGNYQPESMIKALSAQPVRSSKGDQIFKLQTRSFARSKRLRTSLLYMGILFYLQVILYTLPVNDNDKSGPYFIILFISLIALMAAQYGFSVEANFFSALWTKPFTVRRLLYDKYKFGAVMGAAAALLCLPMSIWSDISVLTTLSYYVFSAGFGNLVILFDPYKCVKFDLFGKTFFNYQGSSSTFKGSQFIAVLVVIGTGILVTLFLPGWKGQALLAAIGLAGFCMRKKYFTWVEGNFLKDKYKYMEKYR